MPLDGLRANSLFGNKFYRRAEEVMEESLLIPVEVIEKRNYARVIEPLVSELLPYMGPILLFDMGVVVFMVRSAPGKGNRLCPLGEVPHKMVIQKL